MKPEEIITDEEIERVHAHANFGNTTKRDVVNYTLLQLACGYSAGYTARTIVAEHGLIRTSKHKGTTSLTQRGRKYLWAAFGNTGF